MASTNAIVLILLLCIYVTNLSALCNDTLAEDCWRSGGARTLRRQKRYLVYPEGSSLQLSYDQTIPVVAAQVLFTVGVTAALAFELPSKPLYYITKELKQNLKDILQGETTTSASSDDAKRRKDQNVNDLTYMDKQNYYDSINKHNLYYNDKNKNKVNQVSFWNRTGEFYYYQTVNVSDLMANKTLMSSLNDTMKPNFGDFLTTFVNTIAKGKSKKLLKGKRRNGTANLFLRKEHRVYPVFGKRSVDEVEDSVEDEILTDEDLFYLDHHRNSRFDMYEKIETFLTAKGKNGKVCVLRALCETGQQNQNGEKSSFLVEILRAIFSLPEKIDDYKKDSHKHYDSAHQKLEDDCAELFPECKESFWSHDFIF